MTTFDPEAPMAAALPRPFVKDGWLIVHTSAHDGDRPRETAFAVRHIATVLQSEAGMCELVLTSTLVYRVHAAPETVVAVLVEAA